MGMHEIHKSRRVPALAPGKGAAWLAAALLHLLAAWALTRRPPDPGATELPMELAYIRLPPPPAPVEVPLPSVNIQKQAAASNTRIVTPVKADTSSANSDEPAGFRQVNVLSDEWSTPAAPGERGDAVRFERKSPMASINPIRPGPPERFRMRRQANLADVLRAAAQLLLWPPGYSDDPCAGLAEAAQALSGRASTTGRRALLDDVVKQQNQYCR